MMNGIVDRCYCRAAGLTGIGSCIRMEVNLLIMDEVWSLISAIFVVHEDNMLRIRKIISIFSLICVVLLID